MSNTSVDMEIARSEIEKQAISAVDKFLRPELVEMDMARIEVVEDCEFILDSPEVLDEASLRLARRAVYALIDAGLLRNVSGGQP